MKGHTVQEVWREAREHGHAYFVYRGGLRKVTASNSLVAFFEPGGPYELISISSEMFDCGVLPSCNCKFCESHLKGIPVIDQLRDGFIEVLVPEETHEDIIDGQYHKQLWALPMEAGHTFVQVNQNWYEVCREERKIYYRLVEKVIVNVEYGGGG